MLTGVLFGGIYGPLFVIVLVLGDVVQRGTASFSDVPIQEFLGIMLAAVLVGAIVGVLLGFVVGILVGLVIGAITIRAFVPLRDAARYRQVVRQSAALTGGIGALIGAPLVSLGLVSTAVFTEGIGVLAMFSVVPALLASLALWWSSGRIATWYVRAAGADAAQDADVRIAS
jgi:hypothetical protein